MRPLLALSTLSIEDIGGDKSEVTLDWHSGGKSPIFYISGAAE
jgi:hypothetical protein